MHILMDVYQSLTSSSSSSIELGDFLVVSLYTKWLCLVFAHFVKKSFLQFINFKEVFFCSTFYQQVDRYFCMWVCENTRKKTKLFRMGIWLGYMNNLPFSGLPWTFEILPKSKPLIWIFKKFYFYFSRIFFCW